MATNLAQINGIVSLILNVASPFIPLVKAWLQPVPNATEDYVDLVIRVKKTDLDAAAAKFTSSIMDINTELAKDGAKPI